ncbi:hypothetical protein [Litchfieldella xinjiangensis]|uniref:hypothetical protein n=1 Tax=Litchfieldella xinjiangensis TaxID=1166948 RepID=UPI0005B9DBB5|nr:hypothetical protein [Halomonas xinjiangensis]
MSQELSQHKACEEPKLFIQVMGKEHPEGHRFVFFDLEDQQEQAALAEAVEEEDLPEPLSRIHGWAWEGQPRRNVWLEIVSEEGQPIRVPLFGNVGATPWQEHEQRTVHQHHVVQPVVPLAFWQSLVDDATHALPCRPGYLYIHYRGAVWREIEVGVSESGEWQFRDVDLAQHRNEDGGYVEDRRPATGQPLTELWLPARREMNWLSREVKVAFSDVQWSAARLNHLEANPTAINQRFQSVSLRAASERIASGQLLAADRLVPQRERSPSLETQVAHPPLWTEDLSGSVLSSLYQQALSEQQRFDGGGSDAVNGAWNEANREDSPLKLEVGLRAAAVESVCQANRSTPVQREEAPEPPVWEELPEGSDILEDARQREIPGLVLNDPLFELRHALSQTQLAQNYLSLLLERCASRPHYRSAVMIQKRVMPERIGGESNTLRRFASQPALRYLGGEFHTSVATLARDIGHRLWEFHQTHLADLLGHAAYQRILADYFSLEGSDYVSGFCLAEQCFTALSLDPKRVDTLVDQDIPSLFHTANPAKAQRTLLSLLEDGSREPLHAMCFPDSEAHPVELPFVLPEEETNDGSGRFRAKALAEESERNDVPDKDDLQTFEVSLLAAMAHTSVPGELKRWADALDSVFGKIAESGRNLLGQVADESQRTAMTGRLYLPAFNASRGALHSMLGDLTFQPLGDVDLGRYVLIGVEDVATGMKFGIDTAEREYIARNNHRQFYGEIYRTSDGKLLGGTNKQRLSSMAETGEAREVRFVFAPADSRAADLVRRGSSRIGFAERATDATRLPYIMVVVQAVNLVQSARATKEGWKGRIDILTALIDLSLATFNVSGYMARRHQAPQAAVVRVSNFSQKVMIRNGQANIITRLFPSLIRVNWIASKMAGALMAITMTWEAIERLREGDTDAALAYGMAAAGATMLMLFSGPVGWVGLALLLGGAVGGILLTDGPLEQWIKHGPFGDQRGRAPWLEEPEEAYYRLQGIFANIQVSLRRLSPAERDALLARLGQTHTSPVETAMPIGRLWQDHFDPRQAINTAIEVRSALPGMGVELNDVTVLRLLQGSHYRSPAGSAWRETSSTRIQPLLTQLGAQQITYYVHSPANEPMRGFGTSTEYRWDVQVKFREATQIPLRPSRRIYPAPAPLTEMSDDMSDILSVERADDDYWIKERLNVR